MANVTTTNPMYIDTVGVITTHSTQPLKAIIWVSDPASGKDIASADFMGLIDSNSATIISKRAEAAGDGIEWHFPENYKANGLNMASMLGGICYLYV